MNQTSALDTVNKNLQLDSISTYTTPSAPSGNFPEEEALYLKYSPFRRHPDALEKPLKAFIPPRGEPKPEQKPEQEEVEPSSLDQSLERMEKANHALKSLNAKLQNKYQASRDPLEQATYIPNGKSISETLQVIISSAIQQPEKLAQHYASFAGQLIDVLSLKSELSPKKSDKRFRDQVWRDNILYKAALQTYLAWQQEMQSWIEDLELEEDDQKRAQFVLDQLVAAISPSNSPLNPSAVKRAYQTGGKSAVQGLRELIGDLAQSKSIKPQQIRKDAFKVGDQLAQSEGSVVFANELLELIQYKPLVETVYKRPTLIVPPQLNRFYVFDLSPKNSLVKHMLEQGIQVYIVSWRNPSKEQSNWDLDRYISALIEAIGAIKSISQCEDINLASACAGGLTSMAMIAYLDKTKDKSIYSHTLFVTSLLSKNETTLDLFVTPKVIEQAKQHSQNQGTMDGEELSRIFTWLRPDELIWPYWVNNYLMGKEPPSLDVLFWDNDSTKLPAGLHNDFIDIFIKQSFQAEGQLKVLDQVIDFSEVSMDTFFIGGSEDHLMPWEKCYQSCSLFKGEHQFVLSSSGHIQSILRPPGIAHTYFYTNPNLALDSQDWLDQAQKNEGSWWSLWTEWQQSKAGKKVSAPKILGNDNLPSLYPAPGQYVFE